MLQNKKIKKADKDLLNMTLDHIRVFSEYSSYQHKINTISNIVFEEDTNSRIFFASVLYKLYETTDEKITPPLIQDFVHKNNSCGFHILFSDTLNDKKDSLSADALIAINDFVSLDSDAKKIAHLIVMTTIDKYCE